MTVDQLTMAWFVSPHGYGHAGRACAMMEAVAARRPGVKFEIFTRVPRWFFADSLPPGCEWDYHDVLTDIGLAQKSPLEEDFEESVRRLDEFYPLKLEQVGKLAEAIQALNCRLIVCDISPLGIAVAKAARVPSVLTENFTWDWIYEGYLEIEPRLGRHVDYLRDLFATADHHIQTEPVSHRWGRPDLTVRPVSRRPRQSRVETRAALGVEEDEPLAMVTMGGIEEKFENLNHERGLEDIRLLVIGGVEKLERRGPVIRLPHHSTFYHPDLVHASDAVVGKLGYSTLAEAYAAGTRFLYIPRRVFRESPPLEEFVRREMTGHRITDEEFRNGGWLAGLGELMRKERPSGERVNGADQAAEFLCGLAP